MASITGKLRDLDGWVRNRLRYCIWGDWKKPKRMCGLLICGCGSNWRILYAHLKYKLFFFREFIHPFTYLLIYSFLPWLGNCAIPSTTITLKRLHQKGYESMLDYYAKVAPQFNEPLYSRPESTVV